MGMTSFWTKKSKAPRDSNSMRPRAKQPHELRCFCNTVYGGKNSNG
jgi:hypothetical protein